MRAYGGRDYGCMDEAADMIERLVGYLDKAAQSESAAVNCSEPPRGLLLSIALRLDHGLLCPVEPGMEEDRKRRIDMAMSDARRAWEECTGRGFWSPDRNSDYEQMESIGIGPRDLFQITRPSPTGNDQPLVTGDLATQRAIHDGCTEKHSEAPTPRTDAACILRDPPSPFQGAYVRSEFARQLERELASAWAHAKALARIADEAEAAQSASGALHASAPEGHKCSDCTMDSEPCPQCYEAWWRKRHPNVVFTLSSGSEREGKGG